MYICISGLSSKTNPGSSKKRDYAHLRLEWKRSHGETLKKCATPIMGRSPVISKKHLKMWPSLPPCCIQWMIVQVWCKPINLTSQQLLLFVCVCVSLMVKTTLTNSSKWQSPPAKHQQLMETGQAKPGAFAANNQSGAILPTSTPCRGRKPKCSLVAAKHCRLFVAALSSQSEIESWSFVLALNSNRCFKEVHLVGKSCTCHAYLVFWFDIMNPCFNFSDIEDRTCVWILSSGHLQSTGPLSSRNPWIQDSKMFVEMVKICKD